MSTLPIRAQLYISLLVFLAMLILLVSIPQISWDAETVLKLALFSSLLVATEMLPIVTLLTLKGKADVSLGAVILFASIVLFGPWFSAVITFTGYTMSEVIRKVDWYKKLFNISQDIFKVGVAGTLYMLLHDGNVILLDSFQDLVGVVVAGFAYYVLDAVLVPIAIAFAERLPAVSVWRTAYRDIGLHQLSMIPLGVMFALLWQANPWFIPLAVLPLFVVRRSVQLVKELRDQTKQALLALADAIDARDPSTAQHSQRVAQYAEMIAQQLKMPYDDIEVLVTSARIHDIGKIGMSNELLNKPGIFTPEERIQFQNHVTIGDSLVAKFPAFGIGREVILHHHERYDGKGYPQKLTGEEIAIGARILAAADAFDAMTSDRPYRKAMTKEVALAKLQENAGTQFDPEVVEAFIAALRDRGMMEVPEAEEAPAASLPQPEPELAQQPQPQLERALHRVSER